MDNNEVKKTEKFEAVLTVIRFDDSNIIATSIGGGIPTLSPMPLPTPSPVPTAIPTEEPAPTEEPEATPTDEPAPVATPTPTCLAKGTKITMADGSKRNIEDVVAGDLLLAFDHEKGCYCESPVLYGYKGDAPKCPFTLVFSNGATLSVVGAHDLFQKENEKYVTLSENNAKDFIGTHFYSVEENGYVELLSVIMESTPVEFYEIYTKNTMNMIADGMLNVADDVDFLLNIYEFNADLTINKEAFELDKQKYGLFDFENTSGFSDEESLSWNMQYLNIFIGKGLISLEELWAQHNAFISQRNDSSKSA